MSGKANGRVYYMSSIQTRKCSNADSPGPSPGPVPVSKVDRRLAPSAGSVVSEKFVSRGENNNICPKDGEILQ